MQYGPTKLAGQRNTCMRTNPTRTTTATRAEPPWGFPDLGRPQASPAPAAVSQHWLSSGKQNVLPTWAGCAPPEEVSHLGPFVKLAIWWRNLEAMPCSHSWAAPTFWEMELPDPSAPLHLHSSTYLICIMLWGDVFMSGKTQVLSRNDSRAIKHRLSLNLYKGCWSHKQGIK